MPLIEANGIVLEYQLDGPEDGKPLVLLHELGGSIESWDALISSLQQAGHRILRWNWRGTGASEKIRGDLEVETMCADLAALMDALRFPQPANVAGTALGGGIALAFAARYPTKVRRLAISSPAIGGMSGIEAMLRARADDVEQSGMRGEVDNSLSRSYPVKYRISLEAFTAYRNRWVANDPGSYASHNRMLAGMDERPNLVKIACPTIVLAGKDDRLLVPTAMKEIADAIPGAGFQELLTGHFLPVNTPNLWAATVLPWLNEA
jgi:3-oxoadipate enol-lactonase